jgi:hypothetical protein
MKTKTWFIAISALAAMSRGSSALPILVNGAGEPAVDIPAVQAAVDQGGHVILTGQFSFAARPPHPPAKHTAGSLPFQRTW